MDGKKLQTNLKNWKIVVKTGIQSYKIAKWPKKLAVRQYKVAKYFCNV